MTDRSVSWVGTISDELEYGGPMSFSLRRLRRQEHLFAYRSSLFYTPTKNIPTEHVGSGPLDVTLPIATLTTQTSGKYEHCTLLGSGSTLFSGRLQSFDGDPYCRLAS